MKMYKNIKTILNQKIFSNNYFQKNTTHFYNYNNNTCHNNLKLINMMQKKNLEKYKKNFTTLLKNIHKMNNIS